MWRRAKGQVGECMRANTCSHLEAEHHESPRAARWQHIAKVSARRLPSGYKQDRPSCGKTILRGLVERIDGAGTLGLLPEEIDSSTGAFLGNYPQTLSHIGVISSEVNLARILKQVGGSKGRRGKDR